MPLKQIRYIDLPDDVKSAVDTILKHQQRKRLITMAGGSVLGIATGIPAATYYAAGDIRSAALLAGAMTTVTAIAAAPGWRDHRKAFRREYLQLQRALRRNKTNEKLRDLFASYPFVVIDWHGNLVGRRFAPRIGPVRIGRRRIPSPLPRVRSRPREK